MRAPEILADWSASQSAKSDLLAHLRVRQAEAPHLVPHQTAGLSAPLWLYRRSTFFLGDITNPAVQPEQYLIAALGRRVGSINVLPVVTNKMPLIDDGFEALLEPFYNGKKLTDPISTKEDKFQLLPAFLKVKGTFPRFALTFLSFIVTQLF